MAGEIDRKQRHRRAKVQHKSCLDGVFFLCCEHQTQKHTHTLHGRHAERHPQSIHHHTRLCVAVGRRDYFFVQGVTTSETRTQGMSERVRVGLCGRCARKGRICLLPPRRNSSPAQKISRQRIFSGAASVPRNTSHKAQECQLPGAFATGFRSNAAKVETF
jgi:hypothetical protein